MSFDVGPTGIWLCNTTEPHSFDAPLCAAICEFLRNEKAASVLDLGCGDGRYVEAMRKSGLSATGCDGNPKTPEFHSSCFVMDITRNDVLLAEYDWVLCLEVGEHIPQEHEEKLFTLLKNHAIKGVILSWFPEPGHGIGHFNPRSNDYVIDKMKWNGFNWDQCESRSLRESASLWWFSISLLFFRKVQQN